MGDITILIIEYAARTAVLTLCLSVMIKIQQLNFFFPGVLAAAAIASGLDMIPHFGHLLAVPVLYLCIWKVTGASLMPDAIFTVVVSYALMFAVQVLVFTALVGDLREHVSGKSHAAVPIAVVGVRTATTNNAPPPATNLAAQVMPASAVTKKPKTAEEILKDITVKGVTLNGDKSMLLVFANKKKYELVTGEQTLVQIPGGSCHLRLVTLSENWATVEVNGEAAYLRIH